MKNTKKYPIALSVSLVFACLCAGLLYAGIGIARTGSSNEDDGKKDFHARLRRGMGNEVHQASSGDSPENVEAAAASMAGFIYSRSNMSMSEKTKKRIRQPLSQLQVKV